MPVVERTFRVSARPEDRAIAGLSAGGAATINTAFSRPDLFRYVVIMSAGGGQNWRRRIQVLRQQTQQRPSR